MHYNSNDIKNAKASRTMAVLIAVLMLVSLVPMLPAQGGGIGYLVFRDTVPIGPNLDAEFHAVVPDGVSVNSAFLYMYGTQGVLPVAADSATAGAHDHTMTMAGPHAHTLSLSQGHDHPVTPSGDHSHQVTVYAENVDTEDERMSADLPSHTHTFDGTTRIVDPYDFGPVTSHDHNHTVPAHTHNTLIGQGGDHSHVTDVAGDHVHDVPVLGTHDHSADVLGEHNHSLLPGWSQVDDGVRPSNVEVSVTVDDTNTDVPGSFGSIDADWSDSVDMGAFIGTGVSTLAFTSDSHGMLEYVLVVEVDHPYGVISGQGAMGPGGVLEIPVWAPTTALSATAYLFGGDLAMVGSMADTAGNHSHTATADGDHNHTVNSNLDHTHLIGGGDHEHEGYASSSTPGTTSATPVWSLSAHRHDLTWVGQMLTGMGNYGYGRVMSNNHNHQVVDHDHFTTINVSGSHDHNMSTDDLHGHVDELAGFHDHATDMSVGHTHPMVFSPVSTSTGGPQGVTVGRDGTDLTGANGGPWTLSGSPTIVDLNITSFADPVSIDLTSTSEGRVEWVVLVELEDPIIMVSAHGIAGDMVAHMPVPTTVGGARVGALGDSYVMTMGDQTIDSGVHGHRSTSDGDHSHVTSSVGNHSHDLRTGTLHIHTMTLDGTVVEVLDANGTVDLQPHTHTAALGSPTSSQNMVVGTTGTHSHQTAPHVHDLNFTSNADHIHVADIAGNHTHDTQENGSHVHTMAGGEHDHDLMPGVHYDASFTVPTDVDVQLGDTHPGIQLAGDASRWWEEFTVGGGHLDPMSVETLSANSAQVGSLSFVVWFLMDLEPPEPTLISAPAWVAPGESFPIVIGVPDDIDVGTVSLDIGPVTVDDMEHDSANFTITFDCTAPEGATEGTYDLNLTASDNVGNEATTTLGTLGIDGTPPVVTVTFGEPHVVGQGLTWVTSGTPVDITIEDEVSGPGDIEYAFDMDGPWTVYDPVIDTLFDGQPEGEITLHVNGVDVAGNAAGVTTFDVNIDDSGPLVTITVAPSIPGDGPGEVVASPDAVVSFTDDDGDGIGTDTIFYQVEGSSLEPVREYDRPFPVSSVDMGVQGTFTITWYAWDDLGNVDDISSELTIKIDPVAPIPSPEGDIFLPDTATASPLTVQGNVPGNVARFHYQIDGGTGGIVDIQAGVTFDFIVDLAEGPNTLLYALETPVGVMSEWVVGGVINMDTTPPEVTAVDPAMGSRDLRTKDLSVAVHFSEPVAITDTTVKVNGKVVESDTDVHATNTSASIFLLKELPGNALVEVHITFVDDAGNQVEEEWSYKTLTPTSGSDITAYIVGLVAGLIIGVMLMFFVTFRRKEPAAIVHEGGVATTSIISPDEDMAWHEEDEEEEEMDEEDDEEEVEEGPEDEMDDEEEVEDVPDDDEEPAEEEMPEEEAEGEAEPEPEEEPQPEIPDDWEEGDIEEEEPDLDKEPEPQPYDDTDDLEDEIDRLLEDATSGGDEPPEDLPDPNGATVDPGSRF